MVGQGQTAFRSAYDHVLAEGQPVSPHRAKGQFQTDGWMAPSLGADSTLTGRSGYLRRWSRLDEDFPEVSEVTSLPVSQLLGVVIVDHCPARAWAIVAATNASFVFL
jgi:hypothetical protein